MAEYSKARTKEEIQAAEVVPRNLKILAGKLLESLNLEETAKDHMEILVVVRAGFDETAAVGIWTVAVAGVVKESGSTKFSPKICLNKSLFKALALDMASANKSGSENFWLDVKFRLTDNPEVL